MKRIKYSLFAMICCLLCLLPGLTATAAQNSVDVRFVQSRLPEIKICAALPQSYSENDEVIVRLGSETLNVTSVAPLDESCKTRIYILLDLSTSMKETYFSAAKKAVGQVIDERSENETVVLVTFGKGAPQFYTNDEAASVLPDLQPDNGGTELNEAVRSVLQDAQTQTFGQYDYMYGIVISDGTEYSKGSTTAAEIESQRKLQPVPMFGLCADFAGNTDMRDFRTLVHETGGTFNMFSPQNAAVCLADLQAAAQNVFVITARTAGNTADGDTLRVKAGEVTGETAYTAQSGTDNTPPTVDKWDYNSETQSLVLTVSESLRKDTIQNDNFYLETKNGKSIYPDNAAAGAQNTVTLHFKTPLSNGTYTLHAENVTDNSDSANALQSVSLQIENSKPAAVLWLTQYWYIPVAGVLLVIILAVLLASFRFLKKNGLQSFSDIVTYYKNRKIVIDLPKAGKQPANAPQSKKITVYTDSGNGIVSKVETVLVSSAIFGRGEHCDFVINDTKMSRQHFSIGLDSGKMCIQDLGSTNGTFVNGSRVQSLQVLHSGDKIFAGTSSITIEFQE